MVTGIKAVAGVIKLRLDVNDFNARHKGYGFVQFTQGAIVKLDEIARLAGVSRTTAKLHVINGKNKAVRVSDKTVKKSWR